MDEKIIYKSILREVLLRYYLSVKEDIVIKRIFKNRNERLYYDTLDGNRLVILKEKLYNKLISNGFDITEMVNEEDIIVIFHISKNNIKLLINEDKKKNL